MTPDRKQGEVSRAGQRLDHVANIDEWAAIGAAAKKVLVTLIGFASPILLKFAAYLDELYDSKRKTIDGQVVDIRKASHVCKILTTNYQLLSTNFKLLRPTGSTAARDPT